MAPRIRVALVGCGRIARVHRAYLRQIEGLELVGVWDNDPAVCRRFAEEGGLKAFRGLRELLDSGRPAVVHVLTPPPTHASLAQEILSAGVNVLVEKPLALRAQDADAVLGAARQNGCWVTVDHNRWFDPVVQRAAAQVANNRLGRLVGVEVFQGCEVDDAVVSGEKVHWTAALPGGVLHNLASHPLYLMRRFAGRVADLRVVATRTETGMLEEVRAVALGERAPAVVTLSLRARPFANRLTLLGTEATLDINLNNMTLIRRSARKLPKLLGKVWPNLSEAAQLTAATVRNGIAFAAGRQRYYPGIGAHLRMLYGSVAAGGEPPVSAAEGRDVVAWYEEILAQAGVEVEGGVGDNPDHRRYGISR